MNKETANNIRAICAAAGETVRTATLTGAKAQIEKMIIDCQDVADSDQLRELFTPAISHRTKAGFSEALSTLCKDVEECLSERVLNDQVTQVVTRAEKELNIKLNEFDVAAAIRAIPFFSYSAVLKLLRDGTESAVTSAPDLNADCLRAGATPAEAEDYGRRYGRDALNTFLKDVPLKRMRFHFLRVNENPAFSSADRDFACNCLLKVARRHMKDRAVLNLFNDVDALVMGEIIPDGIKRRLVAWALAF
ncbi:hypothetical protein SB5439_05003 [Klebsiella variicola]|uniref:hypothetical protein n=1 Tax=Klebsiella variicola TaxID=244366 RepID=UPI00109D4F08|nr:hypothetical protein [Klebsiella variicola]VGQ11849.1 hypothetical protein SB5439_05003 [Klebsiella variicola]